MQALSLQSQLEHQWQDDTSAIYWPLQQLDLRALGLGIWQEQELVASFDHDQLEVTLPQLQLMEAE